MNKTRKTIELSTVLILALSLSIGGIILVSAETEDPVEAIETPLSEAST